MNRRLISAIALSWPVAAQAQAGSSVASTPAGARPAVAQKSAQTTNPYGRAIDLTVDVEFYKRDLGEVTVHMAADGSTTFEAADIAVLLKPLLSQAGQAKLEGALAGKKLIGPGDLKAAGINSSFDRENVAISITAIDPTLRKPQSLYSAADHQSELATNALPAAFSFFLDTSVSESRDWGGPNPGFRDPSVFLNSAIRAGPIVLEGEGQIADRDPNAPNRDYRFDRNFLRLVYDDPDLYLRAYLGDLTPEIRFDQNYVQMGGFGISRERRRFDQFRTAILQGDHQLVLERESTVDVYRNGVLFQQMQLQPGSYDLSNLPLLSGSNDIRLSVKDASGFSQVINYQTYLDPIDLDPGDWEGGLYVGRLSTRFGLSPKYDGQLAVTGFYRKAFVDHPAIGLGLQASSSVQQLSLQTQVLIGSGRLDATIAGSHGKLGDGYLAGLVYELLLDQGERSTSVTLNGILQSRHFTGLGAPLQDNSNALNASAVLTHTFNPSFSAEVGSTYIRNRRPLKDGYRLYTEAYYRISRKWFIRAGVDFQHLGELASVKRQNGIGLNISIVFQPSIEDRGEARYDYHYDDAQLSYEHFPDSYVGSIGYGALLDRNQSQTSADGYATYTGNRFDASLNQSTSGPAFGQVTRKQVTTAQISTAIAFADGAFALTPRIGDSFAILKPHESLRGHDVVLGNLLSDSRYRSTSGPLGGAVDGYLSSYVTQSINYDVMDPPAGYDIGLGDFRVRPPYHSGYKLIVGSDSYVTATGTLFDSKGKPVALASGQLIDLGRPEDKAVPFFTNSVGRFALTSLRPDHRYQVKLYTGSKFDFAVPAHNSGLVDLKSVTVPGDQ